MFIPHLPCPIPHLPCPICYTSPILPAFRSTVHCLHPAPPSAQQIDTVELFSFRRHRKLSLRYLASYLLGINIQGSTHDAIEDARTALLLYDKYKQLVRDGTFDEKLSEMYRWGNQYGWEPVVMGSDGKPKPPVRA